jgi:RNA polymerase sigma factor (sigma-70 family)
MRLSPCVQQAQLSCASRVDTEEMPATASSPRTLRLPSRLLRAASDAPLVAALRRGDETAFEEIYDRHHRALLGFCRHMLGSREEAEDALQHVFLSAHRSLCEGSGDVNLKPWLYTIARNRCLSMLRARRETVALDDVHERSGDGLALADEVEVGQDVRDMLGDLARLPVDQRAALVLAELGDLSQRDIATALDVRPDKVKALIFQAREGLAGWRQARGASCREIREVLASAEGSALRRAPLRRHLALCEGCRAFESEVKRQRAAFTLLLPVIPGVALKHSILSAVLSGSHGAAAAGAGGAVAAGAAASGAGAGATGLTAKALVAMTLAVGAGGGGAVAVHELDHPRGGKRAAVSAPARTPVAAAIAPAVQPVVSPPVGDRRLGSSAAPGSAKGRAKGHAGKDRGRSHAHVVRARPAPAKSRGRPTARPLVKTKIKKAEAKIKAQARVKGKPPASLRGKPDKPAKPVTPGKPAKPAKPKG